jgi:hypothetical protein
LIIRLTHRGLSLVGDAVIGLNGENNDSYSS